MAAATTSARRRPILIASWVLQVLLALLFVVGSGFPKLVGEDYAVQIFTELGSGQWLRFVVGLLEVAGGVGLLVPRLVRPAAVGLTLLMVGALFAQLFLLTLGFWFTPLIVGVLTATVAWLQWESAPAPAPARVA